MAQKKTVALLIGITAFTALLAFIGTELTIGLSLNRKLPGVPVKEIYLMGNTKGLYLSIDLDPSGTSLQTIRVPLTELTFAVNTSLSSDMLLSSTDAYIWGDRWPWVEQVTITLRNGRQKEGFDKLFQPDTVRQLQADLEKGTAIGVTHYGLLTGGGRMLGY